MHNFCRFIKLILEQILSIRKKSVIFINWSFCFFSTLDRDVLGLLILELIEYIRALFKVFSIYIAQFIHHFYFIHRHQTEYLNYLVFRLLSQLNLLDWENRKYGTQKDPKDQHHYEIILIVLSDLNFHYMMQIDVIFLGLFQKWMHSI